MIIIRPLGYERVYLPLCGRYTLSYPRGGYSSRGGTAVVIQNVNVHNNVNITRHNCVLYNQSSDLAKKGLTNETQDTGLTLCQRRQTLAQRWVSVLNCHPFSPTRPIILFWFVHPQWFRMHTVSVMLMLLLRPSHLIFCFSLYIHSLRVEMLVGTAKYFPEKTVNKSHNIYPEFCYFFLLITFFLQSGWVMPILRPINLGCFKGTGQHQFRF